MRRVFIKIISFLTLFFLFITSANSQFVDFGRNKVQYSNFDWYVLTTEHFQIHYYKEEKELAEQGAFFAEESYKVLQQKFKHSLIDTVPLIFYSSPTHFKQTNTTEGLIPDGVGGFFEFIKGRVVIPFDGSLGNFKHVIRHELTHVFMISKLTSDLKLHGIISDRVLPLWFTEGLAEYFSTEWDMQAEMVMKDAVLNNYIVGLSDWEEFFGTFFMYKLGQRVLQYISDNFGEDKIIQLIDNMFMDDNFEVVMKYTIGKDYAEFDKDFLYYLKKQYYPQLTQNDNPSQVSKNIFSDGFAHKPAYINLNGKEEIFFIGNRTGYTSIFKTNLEKRGVCSLVIEGESSDEFEQFHYFRTGLDISKNGRLAFITQRGEKDELYIYDINLDKILSEYSFKDIVGIGSPAFSKDNKQIAFSGTEFSGKTDLYILNLETGKLKRLTNDYYDDIDPCFSPDGEYLVFASDRTLYGKNNRYNLFLYNLSNNKIDYLTKGDEIDNAPQFSNDGSKIIFTSNVNGSQNIWMIDSVFQTPTKMKQITNFTTSAFDPKWCGDNNIVFSSYERGNITIRMIDSVIKKFDTSSVAKETDKSELKNTWTVSRLNSDEQKSNLRYEKKFTLDIATTALTTDPVFGTFAGGALSLSDMLSNERYYFLIYNNSNYETEFWKSFNIAISKLSLEKRLNYAYGIYHLSGERYDLTESDLVYYERIYGGYLSFSYPLSFFKRIETSTSLSESEKDIDILNNRRSLLLSNSVSYVRDNTLWYYTGPIDGERLNLTLGYTSDIENSNENYYSILFDYRKYVRLARPTSLAFRGQFFMNEGKNARRYLLGGSWSLRGWPWISIRGTKLWQTNVELRFPLLDELDLRLPFNMNIGFPGIRGAVFFDAGNCWDTKDNYGDNKGSIGAGFRFNLFGAIALRYDIGKRIINNFKSLQTNVFQQFFFGWDF